MKGLTGILIAAGLAIAGAFCNWYYVYRQARDYQPVAFVAVHQDAEINPGDRFRDSDLVPVEVPKEYVGELLNVAIRWKDRVSVQDVPATRSYRGAEILLQKDVFTTPPSQDLTEKLANDEVLFQVVVDAATFIPELYEPGDEVRFFVPQYLDTAPSGTSNGGAAPAGSTRTVGPFRILALGSRKGSRELESAYNRRLSRENVITIALKFPFDARAEELLRLISAGGGSGLRVIKHKPEEE